MSTQTVTACTRQHITPDDHAKAREFAEELITPLCDLFPDLWKFNRGSDGISPALADTILSMLESCYDTSPCTCGNRYEPDDRGMFGPDVAPY